MYLSIGKYFYGKPKYNSLKERTIKRIEGLGIVWGFLVEERVVGRLGVLLFFFFFCFSTTIERCQTNLTIQNIIIRIQKKAEI